MESARARRLLGSIRGELTPCALVDLEAFDANLDTLLAGVGRDQTLRVASKSVRVPALLERCLKRPRVRGILAMHAREARWLADRGFDDVFVAYPPTPTDIAILVDLAPRLRLLTTVDHLDGVEAISRAASARGVVCDLAIDVDLSLKLGPLHLGVRRSPVRTAQHAAALARHIASLPGVRLTAVLAYEAQIAGVQDRTGSPKDLAVRWIKQRSRSMVVERRASILEALRPLAEIEIVNGGGTGSVGFTASDPTVTEISAGSGLFCPHLFDGYAAQPDLIPAAFFALSVVRISDPGFATLNGGGFIASGESGRDRQPRICWPAGVTPTSLEGFGEVQTPVRGSLSYGDTVLARHGKAGELCEHFGEVLLVQDGAIVDRARTYRGLTP